MTEGYRPDGPTTNKVRGIVGMRGGPSLATLSSLVVLLAQEIDTLREYVARVEQGLNAHEGQEAHWDGS